ncbi:MAG: 3-mercaptopyruvate sulfurtransferase [Pseudomonadota bacterium]
MAKTSSFESPMVSAKWLVDHMSAPDLRIVDATWFAPFLNPEKTGEEAYMERHIPGARFFDIDEIADEASDFPHMLPSPEKFASRVKRMGIGDGHRVICYDQNGYFASARTWWMFRVMGHSDVAVLDGGLDAWIAEGGELEDLPPVRADERHFTVRTRYDLFRTLPKMQSLVDAGATQILDARPEGRFTGEAPEPREGLASGHMPGALNLPHGAIIGEDGKLKDEKALEAAFAAAGLNLDKPIVTTCGSGVSAAVLALGLAAIGRDDASVYDGSWSEWAATKDAAIAVVG